MPPKKYLPKIKGKNVIIIFLKEKDEYADYFLLTQLDRDGKNETKSTYNVGGGKSKPSGIDLDLELHDIV